MDEVQHPNHLDFSEATKEVAFFHKDSAALRDLSAVLSAGQSLVPFSPDHSSARRLKNASIPTGWETHDMWVWCGARLAARHPLGCPAIMMAGSRPLDVQCFHALQKRA
jgi:hypothetical protein